MTRTTFLQKSLISLALTGTLWGCADEAVEGPADRGTFDVVMPGKADDYFSNVSKEYEVRGSVQVSMTAEEFADANLREQLVAQRISAVGVYLTTYLTDKFRGIDVNGDGQIGDDEVFFHNTEYGGFKAMVRNQSVEIANVEGQAGEYIATFTIDIAGPNNLLQLLENDGAMRTDLGVSMSLRMPKGATSDQSGRPIRSFNPDTYQGELEQVALEVGTLPEVQDGFPAYRDFMKDGRFEITMVFGHDYNAARYDILDAKEAFNVLVADGFQAPVSRFEDLRPDSGVFSKTILSYRPVTASCEIDHVVGKLNDPALTEAELTKMGLRADMRRNLLTKRQGADGVFGTLDDFEFKTIADVDSVPMIGAATIKKMQGAFVEACSSRQVEVRIDVRLFHSDMYVSNRSAQREQTIYELAKRDVFFYNGHAGPYYGLYLDAEYGAYIDNSEFASLPLDADRQQLFVAQGCQTYSQYADMLYANPAKNEDNLDVITTVNYSYARGTMDLFRRLVQTDAYEPNVHEPATFNTIITQLNAEQVNDAYTVFYGVIGIDQNPKLNPYATTETIGMNCAAHTDCGDTFSGNICAGFTDGTNRCVARTASPAGCPEGSNYAYVAGEGWVLGGVCWAM